jgi:hypothetical protein
MGRCGGARTGPGKDIFFKGMSTCDLCPPTRLYLLTAHSVPTYQSVNSPMKLASLWSNHFSTAPSSWAFWGFNIWAFWGYHTFNAWDLGGYPRQNNQESIIFEPTSRSLDINSKNSKDIKMVPSECHFTRENWTLFESRLDR